MAQSLSEARLTDEMVYATAMRDLRLVGKALLPR